MGNPCLNIGCVIAFLSLVGIIFTLSSKDWKINSQASSQANTRGVQSYEGLWVRCTGYQDGTFTCDNYDASFLALPAQLQAERAMMCLAAIFATFGVIAGAVGLDCIRAMEGTKAKGWTGRAGGILMILAGVLCIATVSWYAADIVYDFQHISSENDTFRYEFGSALYIGWVSGTLAFISGCLLAFCHCGFRADTRDNFRHAYKPPSPNKTITAAEYV